MTGQITRVKWQWTRMKRVRGKDEYDNRRGFRSALKLTVSIQGPLYGVKSPNKAAWRAWLGVLSNSSQPAYLLTLINVHYSIKPWSPTESLT